MNDVIEHEMTKTRRYAYMKNLSAFIVHTPVGNSDYTQIFFIFYLEVSTIICPCQKV